MRVVIGEDSALFREGLARLLVDAGHDVVGKAADAVTLLEMVERIRPDVTVVDVRMPPDHTDDGARAAARLRELQPDLGILLLSQHVETRACVDLVTSGRFGYLLKDRVLDVEDFLESLRRVAAGGTALDPQVVAGLLGTARQDSRTSSLTPREHEVLGLVAQGWSNTGIARRLWLAPRTVETHVSSIMAKLDLGGTDETNRRVLSVLAYLRQPD